MVRAARVKNMAGSQSALRRRAKRAVAFARIYDFGSSLPADLFSHVIVRVLRTTQGDRWRTQYSTSAVHMTRLNDKDAASDSGNNTPRLGADSFGGFGGAGSHGGSGSAGASAPAAVGHAGAANSGGGSGGSAREMAVVAEAYVGVSDDNTRLTVEVLGRAPTQLLALLAGIVDSCAEQLCERRRLPDVLIPCSHCRDAGLEPVMLINMMQLQAAVQRGEMAVPCAGVAARGLRAVHSLQQLRPGSLLFWQSPYDAVLGALSTTDRRRVQSGSGGSSGDGRNLTTTSLLTRDRRRHEMERLTSIGERRSASDSTGVQRSESESGPADDASGSARRRPVERERSSSQLAHLRADGRHADASESSVTEQAALAAAGGDFALTHSADETSVSFSTGRGDVSATATAGSVGLDRGSTSTAAAPLPAALQRHDSVAVADAGRSDDEESESHMPITAEQAINDMLDSDIEESGEPISSSGSRVKSASDSTSAHDSAADGKERRNRRRRRRANRNKSRENGDDGVMDAAAAIDAMADSDIELSDDEPRVPMAATADGDLMDAKAAIDAMADSDIELSDGERGVPMPVTADGDLMDAKAAIDAMADSDIEISTDDAGAMADGTGLDRPLSGASDSTSVTGSTSQTATDGRRRRRRKTRTREVLSAKEAIDAMADSDVELSEGADNASEREGSESREADRSLQRSASDSVGRSSREHRMPQRSVTESYLNHSGSSLSSSGRQGVDRRLSLASDLRAREQARAGERDALIVPIASLAPDIIGSTGTSFSQTISNQKLFNI